MPTPTDFKFACPACGQRMLVAGDWVGRTIRCPACEHPITVPESASPPPSSASESASSRPRPTIRIELPATATGDPETVNGRRRLPEVAAEIQPLLQGEESWPDLMRRLESGEPVDSAAMVTVLFRELTNVRGRLAQLEQQLSTRPPAVAQEIPGNKPAADTQG